MVLSYFTQDDLRTELRRIFLVQAGLIMLARGSDAAEAFISFPPDHDDPLCDEPYDLNAIDRVDLRLFPIVRHFEYLYRQVFEPKKDEVLSPDETLHVSNFVQGLPGCSASGIVCNFPLTQRVADTAHARWKLDELMSSLPSANFTVREIALLASMTEGAVRNAISSRGPDRLQTERRGQGITISPLEALRWLAGRRGFVSRPYRPEAHEWYWKDLEEHLNRRELTYRLELLIYNNLGQPSAAAAKLGWQVEEVEDWIAGKFPKDPTHITTMAEAVGLDANRLHAFIGRIECMEVAQ